MIAQGSADQRSFMSELIVIGYDSPVQARSAYEEVMAMQSDFIADLRGVAIVTVDTEGKSHVESPGKIVGLGAASGALWGILIGLLFFVPFLGKLAKSGINDEFRKQVQVLNQPGKATIVIMAERITEDKFAERMAHYGGTLLKTSLSEVDERELAHDLNPAATPAPS